jgi:hypothetical protein
MAEYSSCPAVSKMSRTISKKEREREGEKERKRQDVSQKSKDRRRGGYVRKERK